MIKLLEKLGAEDHKAMLFAVGVILGAVIYILSDLS